jgi:hypothetical protein
MSTHDINGREYAKISKLKIGDILEADKGFDCLKDEIHIVEKDKNEFYIQCSNGRHYLGDHCTENGEHLIGLYNLRCN